MDRKVGFWQILCSPLSLTLLASLCNPSVSRLLPHSQTTFSLALSSVHLCPYSWNSKTNYCNHTLAILASALTKYNCFLTLHLETAWGWRKIHNHGNVLSFKFTTLMLFEHHPTVQSLIYSHGNPTTLSSLSSDSHRLLSCPYAYSTILLSTFLRMLKHSEDNSTNLVILSATCVPILTLCPPASYQR